MNKRRYLQFSLIGFFLALLIVTIAGEAVLRYAVAPHMLFGLGSIEVLSEDELSRVSTQIIGVEEELELFKNEVSPLIQEKTDELEKALIIKEWAMNQATMRGADIDAGTPYNMLTQMREGRGALCGGMASIYQAALSSVGMQARVIQLIRSNLSEDTHVTVEVLLDNKWVVIDPTFNCYFIIGSEMASATDLHNLLLKNENPKNYEIVYGGIVSYPADFQTYYVDPLVLYNQVFIKEEVVHKSSIFNLLPGFSYDVLPSYVVSDAEKSITSSELMIREFLVITYHFVFPVIAVVSVVALIGLFAWVVRSKR